LIAEELKHQGTYESAGGLLYLSELSLGTPSAAHIEHYARIVLEQAVRRRYIGAAQQVAELAWSQRQDLDTVQQPPEAPGPGASKRSSSTRARMRAPAGCCTCQSSVWAHLRRRTSSTTRVSCWSRPCAGAILAQRSRSPSWPGASARIWTRSSNAPRRWCWAPR